MNDAGGTRREFLLKAGIVAAGTMGAWPKAGGSRASMRKLGRCGEDASGIVIHGVEAGPFDPSVWQAGRLHWVWNETAPLIDAGPGRYRNIYAPTVLPDGRGWRIWYGGWDGVDTPNDRVYTQWTPDFVQFRDRRLEIDHGAFIHVNNCSVVRVAHASYQMMCTAYPDRSGLNKPAGFASPDGTTWNGSRPYEARFADLVVIDGYEPFARADINGSNAILYEDGLLRLYFYDGRNPGRLYRATSRDFRRFSLDGPVLATDHAVNDVKKFRIGSDVWYLMALHRNTDRIWYTLSRNGREFAPERVLTANRGEADRYIVAVGWVTRQNRIFGVLYGAGPVPSLDANRIFARWLQRRVVFEAGSRVFEADAGIGPGRVRLRLGGEKAAEGRFAVYAEDGDNLLYRGPKVRIECGDVWAFRSDAG
ncbi:MAG: hypothetical protein ACP5VE_02195 [Chthonomonadales bacterium]